MYITLNHKLPIYILIIVGVFTKFLQPFNKGENYLFAIGFTILCRLAIYINEMTTS